MIEASLIPVRARDINSVQNNWLLAYFRYCDCVFGKTPCIGGYQLDSQIKWFFLFVFSNYFCQKFEWNNSSQGIEYFYLRLLIFNFYFLGNWKNTMTCGFKISEGVVWTLYAHRHVWKFSCSNQLNLFCKMWIHHEILSESERVHIQFVTLDSWPFGFWKCAQ